MNDTELSQAILADMFTQPGCRIILGAAELKEAQRLFDFVANQASFLVGEICRKKSSEWSLRFKDSELITINLMDEMELCGLRADRIYLAGSDKISPDYLQCSILPIVAARSRIGALFTEQLILI